VDDSVCAENVDGNNARVEVEGQTSETEVDAESLRGVSRQVLALHKSRDGVSDEDSTSRVEVVTDVVLDELLDHLLAGLVVRVVIRERSVLGCEDGQIARVGRIELLYEVWVLADELGELLSVLGRAKKLPNGLIGLVTMVRITVMRAMVRRTMVGWVLIVAVQCIVCVVGSRLEP